MRLKINFVLFEPIADYRRLSQIIIVHYNLWLIITNSIDNLWLITFVLCEVKKDSL